MVWLPCHLIVNIASCLEIRFFFCPSEPNIEEGERRKEKARWREKIRLREKFGSRNLSASWQVQDTMAIAHAGRLLT